MLCRVCHSSIERPIFEAPSNVAITSLCEVRQARTRVWLCPNCQHLNGDPLPDQDEFYEFNYRISLGSDDEDQLYETRGDEIVYRGAHQMASMLKKIQIPADARVLDFGCAKASMMTALTKLRPDIAIHLFDVSQDYKKFWEKIAPAERQAVHQTPLDWKGRFGLITSFFAFEHVENPVSAIDHVFELLEEDGFFYAIVPYALSNVADFIVIDHVNHFTIASLQRLLANAGFGNIEVDALTHRGALTVVARKLAAADKLTLSDDEANKAVEVASYWKNATQALRAAEANAGDATAAIYGAGFYGTYIYTSLAHPERVECFVDRSPYLQGKTSFGKPIVSPQMLSPEIEFLYVGVNPAISGDVIESLNGIVPDHIRKIALRVCE